MHRFGKKPVRVCVCVYPRLILIIAVEIISSASNENGKSVVVGVFFGDEILLFTAV